MTLMLLSLIVLLSVSTRAQGGPPITGIPQLLGRQGDCKDAVLEVNIPRNDLKVVVDVIATPTP